MPASHDARRPRALGESPGFRRPVAQLHAIELGFAIGGFLMWGRLHRAFGVPPSGEGYHAVLARRSAGA
jgi:hypothetical protein